MAQSCSGLCVECFVRSDSLHGLSRGAAVDELAKTGRTEKEKVHGEHRVSLHLPHLLVTAATQPCALPDSTMRTMPISLALWLRQNAELTQFLSQVLRMVDRISECSAQISETVADADGSWAREVAEISGPDEFSQFYAKLRDIRERHRRGGPEVRVYQLFVRILVVADDSGGHVPSSTSTQCHSTSSQWKTVLLTSLATVGHAVLPL